MKEVSNIVPASQVDFEQTQKTDEFTDCEEEERYDLPTELLKMIESQEKQILPHMEELEVVNLGTEDGKREVKIGTTLSAQVRQGLINLLHEYKDVFAWSYQDMPGLEESVAMHQLPIKPECRPV